MSTTSQGRPNPYGASTYSDATHTYSQAQTTGGGLTRGSSGGGQNTTTWQLGEFEAHADRLNRVHDAVLTSTQKTIDAVSNTKDAYGMLFGWAIMPFLNKVGDGTVDFAEDLADAVESSRAAIRMTMAAYNDRETSNAASTTSINAETIGELR